MAGPGERHMAVILATNIEPVRVWEAFRVAVRRTHHRYDCLTLTNRFAAKLGIVGSQPRSMLAGALVAQQLFNGGGDQREVRLQQFELIPMAQQREHSVS